MRGPLRWVGAAVLLGAGAGLFLLLRTPPKHDVEVQSTVRQETIAVARAALQRWTLLRKSSPGYDAAMAEAGEKIEDCLNSDQDASKPVVGGPFARMRLRPSSTWPEVYLVRARYCMKAGDTAGAREALAAAKHVAPDNPELIYLSARMGLPEAKIPDGIAPHEKALLEGLRALKENRPANEWLRKFLEVEPGDDEIHALLR